MSNHSGSYMLNDVLCLLIKYDFFEGMSDEKKEKFVNELVSIGNGHDCNSGEILEGLSDYLKICYCCGKVKDSFEEGEDICTDCSC